ncbi:chaperone protein dnaJ 20, chloroplastic-like [Aristolochia californica]|uniref:chaperone protein dnaJ 20, chloroplastic-like n=1 Tax=Aristolochia californica TaxID=171875 RepID=UPI0035DE02B4
MTTSIVSGFMIRSDPIRMRPPSVTFPSYRRYGAAVSCKASKMAMGGGDRNLYKVLSLESENASFDEIKKAYRRMALQYHPDVCPPTRKEEFTRMFVEVNMAYQTLSDPTLRQNHDDQLGLTEAGRRINGVERWDLVREAWKAQLSELKRQSDYRMRNAREGSWGSRMRANRE